MEEKSGISAQEHEDTNRCYDLSSDGPYKPASLRECLDLLCQTLPRDHYLILDAEKRNNIRVSDIVTGTGTERSTEISSRSQHAIKALPQYIDEITARNCESLGIPLIHALLNVETDSDEDGVPLDESEARVSQIVGRCLLQLEVSSAGRPLVQDLISDILLSKEMLLYSKYITLKAARAAIELLDASSRSPSVADVSGLNFPIKSSLNQPLVQLRNRLSLSISVPSQAAVSSILGNTEGFFVNRAIFGDLIQTLLESARFGKDADMLVPSLMSILQFLRHSFDIDVVKGLLNLVLFHNSVLSIIEEDDELCQLTRHVLKQLEGSDQLPVELKEVCQDLAKSLCIG